MAERVLSMMKNKLNVRVVIGGYCAILFIIILLTSLPYGNFHINTKMDTVNFSSGWTISADGTTLSVDSSLPYELDQIPVTDIELHNKIPSYPFDAAVLETTIFQKDIRVYIDGILVMERVFERQSYNQKTPGSGRIFIPLPANSQGKEIMIQLHKVVTEDMSSIFKISIMDGIMTDRGIISLSSSAFLATALMFFIGVCLLITCLAYFPAGIRIYPMAAMAMFVLSGSLWVMCNSKMIQYFTSNWVLIHNLEYISFFTTPLWLWLFLSYNWDSYKKLCNRAVNLFLAFISITFTAKVLGIYDFYMFLKIFHLLAVMNIGVILVLGFKDIRNQTPALKIFFLGLGGLCFTSVLDLIRYYTMISSEAMAFFYISGIIFMGICLFLTSILMSKDKFMRTIEDNIYKELAFTDILTGLNSRTKWEEDINRIEHHLSSHQNIVTAMIDVNDLKKVNDQFGHHEGDLLLTAISDILEIHFHEIGNCYRLGGDEFCVIVLNHPLLEVADTLSHIADDLKNTDSSYPLSFAWGCAEYDARIHFDLSDVLKEADNKMYEMKRKRKQTVLS